MTDLFVQLLSAHREHLLQGAQTETSVLPGSFVQENLESCLLERLCQGFSKLIIVEIRHLFK